MNAEQQGASAATGYSFDAAFKLWCKYEEITMHFNDLILKLRFQALAGVAGLSALVGVFGRDVDDPTVRSAVISGVFVLLALFWIAIWALDHFYYDKLLTGAVHAVLKLEKLTRERPEHLTIDLSADIEQSFLRKLTLPHPGAFRDGRTLFYGIVLLTLLLGVLFHITPLLELLVSVGPLPPVRSPNQ
jgi:hypothetical protein